MRRFFLLLILVPALGFGQIQRKPIRSGPTNPSTCVTGAGAGDQKLFYNTTDKDFYRAIDTGSGCRWEKFGSPFDIVLDGANEVVAGHFLLDNDVTFIGAKLANTSCSGGTVASQAATSAIPYSHIEISHPTSGICTQQWRLGFPTTRNLEQGVYVTTSGTTTNNLFIGFGELIGLAVPCQTNFGTINQRAVGFRADASGSWLGVVTQASGTNVSCNTGVGWTVTNSYFRFKYDATLGVAYFYIDGALKCTVNKSLAFSTLGTEVCGQGATSSLYRIQFGSRIWRHSVP